MTDEQVQELVALAVSCANNKDKKYNKEFDELIEFKCQNLCIKNEFNITHGSAYNEIRHKYHYYIDKYIKNLIENRTDLYGLRYHCLISDKEIVRRLIKEKYNGNK